MTADEIIKWGGFCNTMVGLCHTKLYELALENKMSESGWIWLAMTIWDYSRSDITVGEHVINGIGSRVYSGSAEIFGRACRLMGEYTLVKTGKMDHPFVLVLNTVANMMYPETIPEEQRIPLPQVGGVDAMVADALTALLAHKGCGCTQCERDRAERREWVNRFLA